MLHLPAHSLETCALGALSQATAPSLPPSPESRPTLRLFVHTLCSGSYTVTPSPTWMAHALPTYRVLLSSHRPPRSLGAATRAAARVPPPGCDRRDTRGVTGTIPPSVIQIVEQRNVMVLYLRCCETDLINLPGIFEYKTCAGESMFHCHLKGSSEPPSN